MFDLEEMGWPIVKKGQRHQLTSLQWHEAINDRVGTISLTSGAKEPSAAKQLVRIDMGCESYLQNRPGETSG